MEQRRFCSISEQRTAYSVKQDDKIANAMNKLNQRKQQAKEEEEIIQILSKPRSKKYIELVKKSIQMTQRLSELEARKKELIGKPEQEIEKKRWEVEKEAQENSEQETEKGWWEVEKEVQENPEQETEKGWWEVTKEVSVESEQTIDNSQIEEEINREMERIQQELEELDRALNEEMPICSRRLGMIYCSLKEETLINQGIISGPGRPYFSLPDLYEQVQAKTEREKKQWKTGDQAYHENWSESMLIVEIYLMAVCVVWDDGSVKCYRD